MPYFHCCSGRWGRIVCCVVVLLIAATIGVRKSLKRMRDAEISVTPVGTRYGLPVRHEPYTEYALTPAMGDLRFNDPVSVLPIPDRPGTYAVAQRNGMIYAVKQREGRWEREVYLDLRLRVFVQPNLAEEGLLSIAFHPQFAAEEGKRRPWLFVSYCGLVYNHPTHRITRYEAPPYSSTIDDRTERVLIDQQYITAKHMGGHLLFGPDGYLYISMGDDGEPEKNAQRIDQDFFSSILRIDVDEIGGDKSHPIQNRPKHGFAQHYYVPNDNPFVGQPEALEEFYALGFRNPWRFCFDRETGRMIVSDVGDKMREEATIIEKGDNGGWPVWEGSVNRQEDAPAKMIGRLRAPTVEYSRDNFHLAIIGGVVYRGMKWPELQGKYIFADQSGRIYASELPEEGKAPPATLIALFEEEGMGVSNISEDEDGELLICVIKELATESGQVYRLEKNEKGRLAQPPELLSQTGLFANLDALEPARGFVEYDVVTPLWSDGAEKKRWISVPPNTTVIGKLRDRWKYPTGTVLLKHFEYPSADAPRGVRRVETRYLVVDERGVPRGASYRWNEDQTDAMLVHYMEEEWLTLTEKDGSKREVLWSYPGRTDCRRCHNEAAGYVLGFNYQQLNRLVIDRERNIETGQLVRLRNLGVLENNFPDDAVYQLPRLAAIDDETADLTHRVKSYLEVHCAPCHRPGLYYSGFDARLLTPLEHSNLLNGKLFHTPVGQMVVRFVHPNNAEHSALVHRMESNVSNFRMPPLGRNVVDEKAVELIREWIETMPPEVMAHVPEVQPRRRR